MESSRRSFIARAFAAAAAVGAHPSLARAGKRGNQKKKDKDKHHALFEDSFRRADRDGWGGAWFNQRYDRRWYLKGKKGVYRLPANEATLGYRPNPILVLDHDVSRVDLRATVSLSNVTGRAGLVARANDYARYYAAYLSPDHVFRVSRFGPHDEKILHHRDFRFRPGVRYRILLHVSGSNPVSIKAKVWRAKYQEPWWWTIETTDESEKAITKRGAFGVLVQHATDGDPVTVRVWDVVARSHQKPQPTAPEIAYSLIGPPAGDRRFKAIAKTAVPATVGFELAPEATFSQNVVKVRPKHTGRAQTARAELDASLFAASTQVFWRAYAERDGAKVVGPTSRFRTPPPRGFPMSFAFGACTNWRPFPHSTFHQAKLLLPDFFLHQGDFGYVPAKVADHGPDTYQDHWIRLLMDDDISSLTQNTLYGMYQDDSEYGRNMADKHTLRKFTIDAWDDIHANPRSDYFDFRYGDVAVFALNCRRFATGLGPPAERRHKLGDEQSRWLKDSMQNAADDPSVGLIVVASPMAFGSDRTPESWRKSYPTEWTDLITFFENLGAPVLIVSGNSHGHKLHEYPQKNLQTDVPRVVEFVSAGTEQKKWSNDIDPDILLKRARGHGFGHVELGSEQEMQGQKVRSLRLTAVKGTDGTPFWTAEYLIVAGVGIVPIVPT